MTEQRLGKYTVIRRLGAGGMAEVYLCRQHGIGGFEKQVVVKRIRADIANDSEFVTMFFDEARLAANLNHPNLIQLFEVDEIDGAPYIAMEYVKGPTLSGLLQQLHKQGISVDLGHLALIFAGACAGLDHAHNAEDAGGKPLTIVHRDISPQNIIISLDGTAKIFDFGVAKARGSLAMTATDRIKGKFAYMAPEQLRSQPVDSRADVYALGVCLYESAVGKRPFVGATEAELYASRLDGRFRRPSEVVEGFPTELEHIILAAMWPDPEGRPTASELRDWLLVFASTVPHTSSSKELAAWMHGLFPDEGTDAYESYASSPSLTPIPNSSSSPAANAVDAARGARHVWKIAAAVVLVAAAVAVVVWLRSKDEARRDDGEASTTPSLPAAAIAPTNDQTVRNLLDKADVKLQEQHVDLAEELLVEARTLASADPVLATREKELTARVYAARVVLAAQRALGAKQYDTAISLATELLRRSDNAEASRILREARDAKAVEASRVKPAPGPVKRPRPAVAPTARIEVKQRPQPEVRPNAQGSGSSLPPTGAGTTAGGGSGSSTSPPGPGPGSGSAARVVTPPVPVVTPPVKKVGSLDAVPTISVDVSGGVSTSEIESALARVSGAFRDCYRVAAKARQETPPVTIRIAFEIDQQRAAREVRVSGDGMGIGACIKTATSRIRIRTTPDIDTISVTAVVKFKPTN